MSKATKNVGPFFQWPLVCGEGRLMRRGQGLQPPEESLGSADLLSPKFEGRVRLSELWAKGIPRCRYGVLLPVLETT